MKITLKAVLAVLMVLSTSMNAKAETYFKADFTSGNLWVDMIGIWATYGINKSKGGIIVDNYLTVNGWSMNSNNNATRTYITSSSKNLNSLYDFKFPDILNGLGTGIKWGYKNESGTFIKNWAVYGSIHTTYNHFYVDMSSEGNSFTEYGNSLMRLSPGAGANITFGKDTSPVSVMLDFNLKYDIPIIYAGEFGDGPGCLNSGFSPRISMIVGGPHLKKKGMNVGVFCEFMSYKLFKESDYFIEPYKAEGFTFGINFTMFPWK